ncbi:MAG: hypothetical protein ACREPR_15715 [Brasilonema sp.]
MNDSLPTFDNWASGKVFTADMRRNSTEQGVALPLVCQIFLVLPALG